MEVHIAILPCEEAGSLAPVAEAATVGTWQYKVKDTNLLKSLGQCHGDLLLSHDQALWTLVPAFETRDWAGN